MSELVTATEQKPQQEEVAESATAGELIATAPSTDAATDAAASADAAAAQPIVSSPAMDGDGKVGRKLAPYNPTNVDAIEMALSLLRIQPSDVLYDLGCGDGRVVVEAAKRYGIAKGVGVEYDRGLCAKATANVQHSLPAEAAGHVHIVHDTVERVDFLVDATAIFVYLVPEGMRAIQHKLKEAVEERGVRVVSYVFSVPELVPVETVLYKHSTKLYLYEKR